MLAQLDEGQRLCGKVDANMGAGKPGKAGACWRSSTKGKGFAMRATPTKTPANRKKLGRVGVARRRAKALRGGQRQQRRRQVGKSRGVLAWLDEGKRLCGEVGANKDADRLEKPRACWRDSTKGKGFAGRSTPTKTPANREKPGRVGVNRRREKKNTEQLNHCSVEVTFFLHQHHLTKNLPVCGKFESLIIIYI